MKSLSDEIFADFMKQMFLASNATLSMVGTVTANVDLVFGSVIMENIPLVNTSLFVTGT